jgi:hypothetical protein
MTLPNLVTGRRGGSMKKQYTLKANWIPTHEKAVLNAIREAKIQNKRIIKIGLPIRVQREIMKNNMPNGKKLKELFGIKVEQSRVMQITTEFYRLKQT